MTTNSRRAETGRDDRWLTSGVAGIGAASFLSDVGHEVATSLMPGLLTTLRAPAAALGLIEGIADGLAGAGRLVGGGLADDPARRRRTAIGGYTLTGVLSALIGAATAPWHVGVARAAAWTARGVRVPARNALLAELVAPERYGRAYGFERAMDNLGAIVGPLLAIGLVAVVSLRQAFAISLIPSLAATGAIVYAMRRGSRTAREHRTLRIVVRPLLHGPFARLLAGISAFELGNAAATLLILRATGLLGPGRTQEAAVQTALLLYTGYNAVATVTSLAAGRLADRFGPAVVLALGAAAFAVAYAGFASDASAVSVLAVWFALAGIGIGCVETAQHTLVAVYAPEQYRGSAFGLVAAVQSFGNFAASGIAGLLWSMASPSAAFRYLTAMCMLAVVLVGLSRRGHRSGRR